MTINSVKETWILEVDTNEGQFCISHLNGIPCITQYDPTSRRYVSIDKLNNVSKELKTKMMTLGWKRISEQNTILQKQASGLGMREPSPSSRQF